MRSVHRSLWLSVAIGVLGLALLITLSSRRIAAQQPERPAITATIVSRQGDRLTLNQGAQGGLRKGDKFRALHYFNGEWVRSGLLEIIRVYGTTADAKILEESGSIGPEDIATLENAPPPPPPAKPARKTPAEPAPKKSDIRAQRSEPDRKAVALLPLLPQFSASSADGVAFTCDFTNDTSEVMDMAPYRTTAHLILDDEDYRTLPVTLTESVNVAPGKTQSFSFHLTDFTVVKDKDIWPLKNGRHTILLKFGGKQYGLLRFDWRGDNSEKK